MPDTAKPKSGVEKRTISLSSEQAAFIDAKVTAGGYASASEVVREGIRAMQAQDAALENFLKTEVRATYEALKADPGRAVPIERAFKSLYAKIESEEKPGK